jgi:hypothetical protein
VRWSEGWRRFGAVKSSYWTGRVYAKWEDCKPNIGDRDELRVGHQVARLIELVSCNSSTAATSRINRALRESGAFGNAVSNGPFCFCLGTHPLRVLGDGGATVVRSLGWFGLVNRLRTGLAYDHYPAVLCNSEVVSKG